MPFVELNVQKEIDKRKEQSKTFQKVLRESVVKPIGTNNCYNKALFLL